MQGVDMVNQVNLFKGIEDFPSFKSFLPASSTPAVAGQQEVGVVGVGVTKLQK